MTTANREIISYHILIAYTTLSSVVFEAIKDVYLKYGHLAIKMVRWAGIRWPRYTSTISEQLPDANSSAILWPRVAAGGLAKFA